MTDVVNRRTSRGYRRAVALLGEDLVERGLAHRSPALIARPLALDILEDAEGVPAAKFRWWVSQQSDERIAAIVRLVVDAFNEEIDP